MSLDQEFFTTLLTYTLRDCDPTVKFQRTFFIHISIYVFNTLSKEPKNSLNFICYKCTYFDNPLLSYILFIRLVDYSIIITLLDSSILLPT